MSQTGQTPWMELFGVGTLAFLLWSQFQSRGQYQSQHPSGMDPIQLRAQISSKADLDDAWGQFFQKVWRATKKDILEYTKSRP